MAQTDKPCFDFVRLGEEDSTFDTRPKGACGWCSGNGSWTIHTGVCPKVKAIEYHPNGTIKRVEFHDGTD